MWKTWPSGICEIELNELCQRSELQRLGHSHLGDLFRSLFLKMLFLVLQLLKHKTSGTYFPPEAFC